MDKLRPILAAIQKYQFWGLSVLVTLVALACWWLATSGLAGQYQKRKSSLDSTFTSAKIEPNHPNEKVIAEVNKQHDLLKQNVFSAWETLYNKQKEQNPFPAVLGEEFRKRFEELKPKETLARQYLELYQNFIKGHLPTLRTKINVRRPKDEHAGTVKPTGNTPGHGPGMPGMGAAGGRGGDDPRDVEMVGVVEWDDRDYAKLTERFEWRETPSTLAVVLAQEDLWVYEALLRVIASANKEATGPTNAAVKRIEALQIGKEAVGTWKSTEKTVFTPKTASGPEEPQSGMPPPMMPSGTSEEQARRQMIEHRYIDDKGEALAYDAEFPYAKHPYAEFKLMPICMNLVIDQRRLPKLLTECANSNMPIEVRRVRLLKNRLEATDLTGGAGSASVGAGGSPLGMGGKPGSGGMPGAGMGGAGPTVQAGSEAEVFEVPVEIQAVIYIYSPPDREKLGTGTASEPKAEAGAAGGPKI